MPFENWSVGDDLFSSLDKSCVHETFTVPSFTTGSPRLPHETLLTSLHQRHHDLVPEKLFLRSCSFVTSATSLSVFSLSFISRTFASTTSRKMALLAA